MDLVEHDERLGIVPGLATQWTPSRDGRTWTFRLRQGVRFHDGTVLDAEADQVDTGRAQLRLPSGQLEQGRDGDRVPAGGEADAVDGQVFEPLPVPMAPGERSASGLSEAAEEAARRAEESGEGRAQ